MKHKYLMLGLAAIGAVVVGTVLWRKLIAPAKEQKSSPYVQNVYTTQPLLHGTVTPVGPLTVKTDMYDADFVNSLRE